MRVYINDDIHPVGYEKLKQHGVEVVSTFDEPEKIDGMIVRGVVATREIMEALPNLKVVGKHGVGYNTIDVDAAKAMGIRVVYTPGQNAQSVAELVVGMMIDVSRKLSAHDRAIRSGLPQDMIPNARRGSELSGKICGLIGMGNVAQHVAQILRLGFGMKLIGYDTYQRDEVFDAYGVDRLDSLEALLPQADYISISVPLTDKTRDMIGTHEFGLMKPEAILINAARGGIVNENALYEALKDGIIAGAASDVFCQEPPERGNPLFSLNNFVGSPHIGGSTGESIYRCTDTVVEEVLAVLEGRSPRYAVC